MICSFHPEQRAVNDQKATQLPHGQAAVLPWRETAASDPAHSQQT
ncbi:Unknown protein sequence [Pseudomonas amygdali pv. lachrymans]|uniref:Uncharacterized protein n=1 Tax=Pseudomonas syringae pv. maculicola TaxID=59511 RepID=A0A0N0WT67_PSEYM|nr:Unknown protein sequence [Pseudomonas syringae pv. maculicola str. M6]KPB90086.1 Unknown protein sequence [Pseudomonas syringae pv. maculicola]KPC09014.1 Unknown protein sequence [Pseudomonas amygdali pv. lachrymans]RMV35628.1 hypothetical protein ALP13_102748 [Pseudomonas syringae pv. maculicola]